MARKKYIIANWKMALLPKQERALIDALPSIVSKTPQSLQIVVCPSFLSLEYAVSARTAMGKRIAVGSQDCSGESLGAFTGEISPASLKSLGCSFVIVGHSERRTLFLESSDMVAKKVSAAYSNGLTPIVCVGEKVFSKNEESACKWIASQIEKSFYNVTLPDAKPLMIAYEPLWSIGSGKRLDIQRCERIVESLRTTLARLYPKKLQQMYILYGGSVTPQTAADYLHNSKLDGILVGGASQSRLTFGKLMQAVIPAGNNAKSN